MSDCGCAAAGGSVLQTVPHTPVPGSEEPTVARPEQTLDAGWLPVSFDSHRHTLYCVWEVGGGSPVTFGLVAGGKVSERDYQARGPTPRSRHQPGLGPGSRTPDGSRWPPQTDRRRNRT